MWSERIGVELPGADADDLVEVDDEHLAVADLAGAGGAADRRSAASNISRGDRGLDLELGQEVDDVFGAAVQLGVAFCRPKPLTSVTVRPDTPTSPSASRTSSSLNGRMMAVISFMQPPRSERLGHGERDVPSAMRWPNGLV